MSFIDRAWYREVGKRRKTAKEATQGRCFYCGVPTNNDRTPRQGTLDHIHPRSEGGYTLDENLVWACHSCNNRKGNRDIEVFRAEEGGVTFYGEGGPVRIYQPTFFVTTDFMRRFVSRVHPFRIRDERVNTPGKFAIANKPPSLYAEKSDGQYHFFLRFKRFYLPLRFTTGSDVDAEEIMKKYLELNAPSRFRREIDKAKAVAFRINNK